MIVAQFETLSITSQYYLDQSERNYLEALSYLFQTFKGMDIDNTFCMYVDKNAFLIADHKKGNTVDPIVFVDKNGNILFEIDIQLLEKAKQEFEKYIAYYHSRNQELPEEKILQNAIKDYKNDKLDFYANSKVVLRSIIDKAHRLLDDGAR